MVFNTWWNSEPRCQDERDSALAAWNAAVEASARVCEIQARALDGGFKEYVRYHDVDDCAKVIRVRLTSDGRV